MDTTFDVLARLTGPALVAQDRQHALRLFAQVTGWQPSDEILDYPGADSNGHLVVEHGLDNTAVITFLSNTGRFPSLGRVQQLRLLGISYNNLVDWHLFPERDGVTVVNNRTEPHNARFFSRAAIPNIWFPEAFDDITPTISGPSHKTLDDALIGTISRWKRIINSELPLINTDAISTLFNSILFTRALEDQRRTNAVDANGGLLLERLETAGPAPVSEPLIAALSQLGVSDPSVVLGTGISELRRFDALDRSSAAELFRSFYDNAFAPYRYDFALISKHALSRIYEHYVSLLRDSDSSQLAFFPPLPEEVDRRQLGGVYTPQYIARFFVRFLKENLTPRHFRSMRIADPACGSGMFLRTSLEMQCSPWQEVDTRPSTQAAFGNLLGIDVDRNACLATRLSLSLLHLALTGVLPPSVEIANAEALQFVENHQELLRSFDAVYSNPPYVKWDRVPDALRSRIQTALGDAGSGKNDLFHALLAVGIDLLRPGGFGLYVVPHSFLIARSAARLRQRIARSLTIRMIVDLSGVDVFEGVGSYVVLLILEKRDPTLSDAPPVTVVKCRDLVGRALQEALQGREASNTFYSIYSASQESYRRDTWEVLAPLQHRLRSRLERLPQLDDYADVRQGFVTGADDIFARRRAEIPEGEEDVYVPYLTDREMRAYSVPQRVGQVVFYPYLSGKKISESQLRDDFPRTWNYLKSHGKKLSQRRAVIQGQIPWWSPERPRVPDHLFVPKIVSPHLVLLPKFSLDMKGSLGVSHSPFVTLKADFSDNELLFYLLALLNSTVGAWQLSTMSHRYSRGYLMLEPTTLRRFRVPSPTAVSARLMQQIVRRTKEAIKGVDDSRGSELDGLVSEVYGLTAAERSELSLPTKS